MNIATSNEALKHPMCVDGYEAIGLVDYAQARATVQSWLTQRSSRRAATEPGVWMDIPHGEYLFSRLGFDKLRASARSFLFFTRNTFFINTTFAGLNQTLLKKKNPQEAIGRSPAKRRRFLRHRIGAILPEEAS